MDKVKKVRLVGWWGICVDMKEEDEETEMTPELLQMKIDIFMKILNRICFYLSIYLSIFGTILSNDYKGRRS